MRAFRGPLPSLCHVHSLPPSATLAINELSNDLIAQGRKVYKLGLGQSPFPVPGPMVDALKASAHHKDYLPVRGLKELREAVAGSYGRVRGSDVDPDHVIVGPGSKELLFLVQMCYRGELVLPMPSWVSYAPQSHLLETACSWVPTTADNHWKLQPEDLDAHLSQGEERPRVTVLNYPSNPTGTTYGADELAALADVFRKHRVLVVSDEIYGGVTFSGTHHSIATHYPEGTIVLEGVSKRLGAGGWRLGVGVAPPNLSHIIDTMAVVASETFTSVSAPIQAACVTAYSEEGEAALQPYLKASRDILAAIGGHVTDTLNAVPGVDVVPPLGGFYAFPNVASSHRVSSMSTVDSQFIAEALLRDTGVALLSGCHFGAHPSDGLLRLAFVDFEGGAAMGAVGDLPADPSAFLSKHCANVVEGVDAMAEWLTTPQ